MKKIISLVYILSTLFLLIGCDSSLKPRIVLPADLTLYVGDNKLISATIEPVGTVAEILWKSSNTSVVVVDANGQFSALSEGTATVTASANGLEEAQCLVTVIQIPSSFPRKFVIEHFTGDQCGYCPGGMYAITNYIKEQCPSAIWLSHHYGFNQDEYTISESSKIGKMLGVSGAPNMALNRTKQQPGMAFHPAYLPSITIKDDTLAEASVEINHTFDPVTRLLEVRVDGYVADSTVEEYLLTVLIKENGLVGRQADYEYSWKTATWKEYMHARVVRTFLTDHFGDAVAVENQRYSASYVATISNEWVPENCCVVAYLTSTKKKPIINAEQTPLVAGTHGGEQYYPYGITEGQGPNKTIAFDSIIVSKVKEDIMEIMLIASKSVKTNLGAAKPVAIVNLLTKDASLQPGTYPVQGEGGIGTIVAGYRIDEQATFGGSSLVYALSTQLLQEGLIVPAHMWRINSGDMVVSEDGKILFLFETYNGTAVSATYEPASVTE